MSETPSGPETSWTDPAAARTNESTNPPAAQSTLAADDPSSAAPAEPEPGSMDEAEYGSASTADEPAPATLGEDLATGGRDGLDPSEPTSLASTAADPAAPAAPAAEPDAHVPPLEPGPDAGPAGSSADAALAESSAEVRPAGSSADAALAESSAGVRPGGSGADAAPVEPSAHLRPAGSSDDAPLAASAGGDERMVESAAGTRSAESSAEWAESSAGVDVPRGGSTGGAPLGGSSGDVPTVESVGGDASGVGAEGAGGSGEGAVQPELDELADPERLRGAVEAVLLVLDTPTSTLTLAQVLGRSVPEVEGALHGLRDEYDAGGRGIDLREVAEGWRLYSRDEFAAYVERFVLDGQQARLTQAALETLAVIAYRQPVTRSRISGIRGVSVDAVMRTLLTRGLVEECGADPDTGGGLYRTTRLFLEKMGLRSLDDLPSLAPLLPDTSQLDDVELST